MTVHQTSDSAIMKQSLLHKRLLTTVNTSGRYVHKKDDYSGYSEQYCYFCEKRPLVLAKYNLKWVTEVDVFSFVNYLNGGAELI